VDPTNIRAVPSPVTPFMSWWALENGTNTNYLPTNNMTPPGRAKTSTIPWSEPQISESITFPPNSMNHSNLSFSGQPYKRVPPFAYLSVIDLYAHRVLLFNSISY